jgi:hexokinase
MKTNFDTAGFNPAEIEDFARFYEFHYDCCDSGVMMRDFRIAMERGLSGRSSSLAMIPTYISPAVRPSSGKRVVALDAGGTNMRAARIYFDRNEKPVVEDKRNMPMPGTSGALKAEEFFSSIAAFCEPLFDGGSIEGIGFCFSYPMEITPDGDGIPSSFCKEVDLTDLIGRPLGRGLLEALARRKIKTSGRIALLNDTVSALLCGLSQLPEYFPSKLPVSDQNPSKMAYEAGQVVSMILGTGFNIAYCEKNIPKINFESETGSQIVVCESGNFRFRYQGILDREFDASTKNPGMYGAEKATAGAYLGPLSLHVLKQAVSDGLLRFKRSAELLEMKSLATKDLNVFLQAPRALAGPLGGLFDRDERDAVKTLVYLESIITERAALIAASALAAVLEHCGDARDPLAPARIAVDGTTFSMYHFLKEALGARLYGILNTASPRFLIMQAVEQASLFGAAAAAL